MRSNENNDLFLLFVMGKEKYCTVSQEYVNSAVVNGIVVKVKGEKFELQSEDRIVIVESFRELNTWFPFDI